MNGWFEEQVKLRIKNDSDILEDSYVRLADVILDHRTVTGILDDLSASKTAVNDVLLFFGKKPVELPNGITAPADQFRYAFRPHGIMGRETKLKGKWYKKAFSPVITQFKDSGISVALIPDALWGYRFRDPQTGKNVRITRKNALRFADTGYVFYEPLPMQELGIRDLMLYIKRSLSYGDIALIAVATLAVTLIGLIEPEIYSRITGTVLQTGNMSMLAGMCSFLICSAFAGRLFVVVRGLLMERMSIRSSQKVEASVMMRILCMPAGFFKRFSSGELSNRVESVGALCSLILNNIFSVGLGSLMSLIYIVQISGFAPSLTGPAVFIIVVTVIISLAASQMQMKITRRQNLISAKEDGMRYAMYGSIQKIRLSGAEKRFMGRWARLYAEKASFEYDPPYFIKIHRVLITAVSLIGTIVLYYIAVGNNVLPSQYYAFNAAYGRLMAAFGSLAGIAVSISGIVPALEMSRPVLETVPETAEGKEIVESIKGSIDLDHVYFRYEDSSPYILEDMSLKIKAGEYVALVGPTGCGKSTLVRLLLGFEKPDRGAIYYDRKELSHLDPPSLRKKIGVCLQNGQLLSGDIYTNITISAPELSEDDAWDAASIAGIAEDIKKMPMGMNTYISEGQGGISGGQKQRLLIARAIASHPKILILDEATSALDNVTQKQISKALDDLSMTRIVIAHRLSTVKNCDRILVMDGGKITEEGTYDELMALDGLFARLVERQKI